MASKSQILVSSVVTLLMAGLVSATTFNADSMSGQDECDSYRDPCSSEIPRAMPRSGPDGYNVQPLWAGLIDWTENKKMARLESVLTDFLVSPPPGSPIREWTLAQLRGMIWIVDFTPFERVFRQCDRLKDYACSQVFVENKLVFGPRPWKVKLLKKAVTARGSRDSLFNTGYDFRYRGFRFKMNPLAAKDFVLELGLTELYPDARQIMEDQAEYSSHWVLMDVDGVLDAWESLIGTEVTDVPSSATLADRLAELGPVEIYSRILNGDPWFSSVISFFQTNWRYPRPFGGVSGAPMIASEGYEPLMEVLGKTYREFVLNPPPIALVSLCQFNSLNARLLSVFRGERCGSSLESPLEGQAFGSFDEYQRAIWSAYRAAISPEELANLDPYSREFFER